MLNIQHFLSLVAGPLQLTGFLPYVIAIRRGRTKPCKATWIIWGTVDLLLAAGMYAEGTLNAQMIGALLGVFVVIWYAWRYGESGWSWTDKICLSGAVLGLVLWASFSNPSLAILASVTVLWIGAVPTFRSAWEFPEKEDKLAWTIFSISGVCAVLGIPVWTFADAAQPLTFFLTDFAILLLAMSVGREAAKKAPR